MLTARSRLAAATAGLLACALGYTLGDTYLARLSNLRGYQLVPVNDAVRTPLRVRPRKTLVAVLDGVRLDAAESFSSIARVRAAGQCLRTSVGLPTLSRPSYATISSGVEQDRTGVRSNAASGVAPVESIWEVARRHGLRVEGRSELVWWRELFPRGFDAYVEFAPWENGFARDLTADVTLVHPVYVDESAHQHGAASAQYASAARRVDRELLSALTRLDLRRDLVVVTADHGHRDAGGHGGAAPEVSWVLTCFAGRGVAHRTETLDADTRLIAPALSALLGLPLPRHLRALEDPLDHVARILDRDAVGADYYDDRLVAITRARATNAAQLRAWTGGAASTWSDFNERLRRLQLLRALGLGIALATLTRSLSRRLLTARESRITLALGSLALAAFIGLYAWRAGGLDLTSLGARSRFIRTSLAVAGAGWLVAAIAHRALGGTVDLFTRRVIVSLSALVSLHAMHVAAFGWPLGSPLPGPYLFFAPFLGAPALVVTGAVLVLFAAIGGLVPSSREGGESCDGPPP